MRRWAGDRSTPLRWKEAVANAAGEPLAQEMLRGAAWPTLAARLAGFDAAGMDSSAILTDALSRRSFADAEDVAAILHWRIGPPPPAKLTADLTAWEPFALRTPKGTSPSVSLAARLAEALDSRVESLGRRLADQRRTGSAPGWTDALGELPPDPEALVEWERRAGIVATYRETFGVEQDGCGKAPPQKRPEAHRWWRQAAAALGQEDSVELPTLGDPELSGLVEHWATIQAQAPPPAEQILVERSSDLHDAEVQLGLAMAMGETDAVGALATERDRAAASVAEAEQAHSARQSWLARHDTPRRLAEAARNRHPNDGPGRAQPDRERPVHQGHGVRPHLGGTDSRTRRTRHQRPSGRTHLCRSWCVLAGKRNRPRSSKPAPYEHGQGSPVRPICTAQTACVTRTYECTRFRPEMGGLPTGGLRRRPGGTAWWSGRCRARYGSAGVASRSLAPVGGGALCQLVGVDLATDVSRHLGLACLAEVPR